MIYPTYPAPKITKTKKVVCSSCAGKGTQTEFVSRGTDSVGLSLSMCSACSGTGSNKPIKTS